MAIRTSLINQTMHVLFWIIYIGLCIKTGAILVSYGVSMFVNPVAASNLYKGTNMFLLHQFSKVHYSIIVLLFVLLNGLMATIGHWVIKITLSLNMEKPFSETILNYLFTISKLALYTGLVAMVGAAYSKWLLGHEISVPIHWAYGEILFFAGVIFIMAQVFKKGTVLQSENELTV
jgi:hypothetical protein